MITNTTPAIVTSEAIMLLVAIGEIPRFPGTAGGVCMLDIAPSFPKTCRSCRIFVGRRKNFELFQFCRLGNPGTDKSSMVYGQQKQQPDRRWFGQGDCGNHPMQSRNV